MPSDRSEEEVTIFLCGDVMTGRGVDQVLPRSCPPALHEPHVESALEYVALAEAAHGAIPRPIGYHYLWGDALATLERERPQARIVNLETSVTTSDDAERKAVLYRMHPDNVPVLQAAQVDCCVVANNHVGDWGTAGLVETLDTLRAAGLGIAGAGRDAAAAEAPCAIAVPGGRLLVFAFGATDSGVPTHWRATPDAPGVSLLPDYSSRTVEWIGGLVARWRRPGDLAIASLHWGGNWGYDIPDEHRRFAHALVSTAGVDLVHGHSSHHPIALEVYRERLILYGCGDLLDDYEGIRGYEQFRDDLVLMYFPTLQRPSGCLARLRMVPMQVHRFRLRHPTREDRAWLRATLERELRPFGCGIRDEGDAFVLQWSAMPADS